MIQSSKERERETTKNPCCNESQK